jgi:dTDP-4-amino-4,6-dideoxygalactose transaminase
MITMNNFVAEPRELQDDMLAAVARVLGSGRYILGREVEEFEARWAAACGVGYGVGVGNGMDAIEVALRALDIGPGSEVITTPLTAFATVLAVLRAGATPVFADIDPATALLSVDSAARCVTPRTRAVLLVHLYGQVRAMGDWLSFCHSQGIGLIEDCAQAHHARWHGKSAGAFGLAGAFSFYPTKNLGAVGDAGMLVTDDPDLARRAARLRNYGQSERYSHPVSGLNSRLDELQAAVLSERLRWLPDFNARRRAIASSYHEQLKSSAIRVMDRPEAPEAHVHHLFVITCSERDALRDYLLGNGIESAVHYPIPAHLQQPARHLPCDPAGLAASEEHAATCLSLPCHPQLSDADVQRVADTVNSFAVR